MTTENVCSDDKRGIKKLSFTFKIKFSAKICLPLTEAATGGLLLCIKKIFLKISQNSQENTCARVSLLIKLLT